jgi:carboxypeptidase family protein
MWSRRGIIIAVTLVSVSASALASAPGQAAESTSGEITGVVVGKPASGITPLAGVSVCATNAADEASTPCATTDESGDYSILELPAGDYAVKFAPPLGSEYLGQYFQAANSRGEARLVSVTAGYATTGVDAVLQPTPLTGPPLQKELSPLPIPEQKINREVIFPSPPVSPPSGLRPAPELVIPLVSPLSPKALSAMTAHCWNAACHGTAELLTHDTAKGWSKRAIVLGSATFSLKAEQVTTIAMRLTRAGRERLTRNQHRRIAAHFVVTVHGARTQSTLVLLT